MARAPAVSLITPTHRRHAYLAAVHGVLTRQTFTDFEWLILDDGPDPSPYFQTLDDPRVRYRHVAGPRLTVGTKRNLLAEDARADVIAHIDDDDYYAPRYLETMLGFVRRGADIAKLSAWFLYSKPLRALGYWDLERLEGLRFVWSTGPVQVADLTQGPNPGVWEHLRLGYGFSYVYRKSTWARSRFIDADFDEDTTFVRDALSKGADTALIKDTLGVVLHVLHGQNASKCLPQYNLPDFALTRFFPADVVDFLKVEADTESRS